MNKTSVANCNVALNLQPLEEFLTTKINPAHLAHRIDDAIYHLCGEDRDEDFDPVPQEVSILRTLRYLFIRIYFLNENCMYIGAARARKARNVWKGRNLEIKVMQKGGVHV